VHRREHSLRPSRSTLLPEKSAWYVTKVFWDATPFEDHIFVADPQIGSRHNRGCAVDLTLYDLSTGRSVEMPGLYDEMSPRSFPDFPGGTSLQHCYGDLLRRAMESEGFTVYEDEWWHFDFKDWKYYPILNVPFENPSPVSSKRGFNFSVEGCPAVVGHYPFPSFRPIGRNAPSASPSSAWDPDRTCRTQDTSVGAHSKGRRPS
jgi:D-ala-D-ala dipeptidase